MISRDMFTSASNPCYNNIKTEEKEDDDDEKKKEIKSYHASKII